MARTTAKHGRAALVAVAASALSACLSITESPETGPWVYATPCTDAGAGEDADLDPSNFDHACKVDSDCVAVDVGSRCPTTCGAYAINRVDLPRYECNVNALTSTPGPPCSSTCDEFTACCIDGFCESIGEGQLTCPDQSSIASISEAADASAE